jgi:GH15 family glucan-1,4-alpha-glucosidase
MRLGLTQRALFWNSEAAELRSKILEGAWDEKRGAITGAFGHADLDASVLLFAELGLLAPTDERFTRSCDAIGRELMRNNRIMRYTAEDDFGAPETAFLVCNFWYMDALTSLGRHGEARDMFTDILDRRNAFGLLSEDIHPVTGALWGNFPQTYSMAGIINTAMRLSASWEDAWARGSS